MAEREGTWTRNELVKVRGWKRSWIEQLGEPDERLPNPHGYSGCDMQLFKHDRVVEFEQSFEFQVLKEYAEEAADVMKRGRERSVDLSRAYKFQFGIHKGRRPSEMVAPKELDYLLWLCQDMEEKGNCPTEGRGSRAYRAIRQQLIDLDLYIDHRQSPWPQYANRKHRARVESRIANLKKRLAHKIEDVEACHSELLSDRY
jgi:hypothetical protein